MNESIHRCLTSATTSGLDSMVLFVPPPPPPYNPPSFSLIGGGVPYGRGTHTCSSLDTRAQVCVLFLAVPCSSLSPALRSSSEPWPPPKPPWRWTMPRRRWRFSPRRYSATTRMPKFTSPAARGPASESANMSRTRTRWSPSSTASKLPANGARRCRTRAAEPASCLPPRPAHAPAALPRAAPPQLHHPQRGAFRIRRWTTS